MEKNLFGKTVKRSEHVLRFLLAKQDRSLSQHELKAQIISGKSPEVEGDLWAVWI